MRVILSMKLLVVGCYGLMEVSSLEEFPRCIGGSSHEPALTLLVGVIFGNSPECAKDPSAIAHKAILNYLL